MKKNVLQYESNIWATANLLRGSGIKESEWPSFMMPFFALEMIESRLLRMLDELKEEIGEKTFNSINKNDLIAMIQDRGQGYNAYIFEQGKTIKDICKNDKSFEIDFEAYLRAFDGETKDLLGVEASEGDKFLDIQGVIAKLKSKKIFFSYTKEWSEIDLKPFNNSEITTLEEHIKRKWADISAETAGEQYTPDDVIALISEIIASKIEESNTLLKIYDCTCGGGNMLFGVEDRINEKLKRFTQTFGQDWNDALYALAKIESRFREDSHIEHGNTLTDDKFYNDEFDVVVANPPYGVDWKGYQKDIVNDKTQRFHYLPNIGDGQLLFMQHLISKLDATGVGVVVSSGSALFSGNAGSSESNIRKWMLETDIVEALIQLPTNEFFNTGIYTYLWVLNKSKPADREDKIMLINASDKFIPLKKAKGDKRKEVDHASRLEISQTLGDYEDNEYARIFAKEFFYFNKQGIQLTNVDHAGRSFEEQLEEKKKSQKLKPNSITNDKATLTEMVITEFEATDDIKSLKEYNAKVVRPLLTSFDYNDPSMQVVTDKGIYSYDGALETLICRQGKNLKELGCGKITIKSSYKKATKILPMRIEITAEITPDYQKDYEIIPFHRDEIQNQAAIEAFMAKYISKPFIYLENVVGIEIVFNKIFYKPKKLHLVDNILKDLMRLDEKLKLLEEGLAL